MGESDTSHGEAESSHGGGDTDSAADRRRRCETIIHASAAAAGAAASVAPLPGSDSVLIMPIQVAMVAALAKEHGIAPSTSLIKSTIYASLGSIVGKASSGLLLRVVPIAGNLVRASVALAVTEGLGQLVLERLEKGEGLV